MSKGTLWDSAKVQYHKGDMFKPCKCFYLKYNGYTVPIGGFHDFVSCEIINELVKDAIGDD